MNVDSHARAGALDLFPSNWCPSCDLEGPVVDVGYGTPREIDAVRANLPGPVGVMFLAFEPFTTPIPHVVRLRELRRAGTVAAIVIDTKDGRRAEYHNTSDWSERDLSPPSMPVATTSREYGAFLRHSVGSSLALVVESEHFNAPSANVCAELGGSK